MRSSWCTKFAILSMIFLMAGCGDTLGRVWVSGKVTYNGQLVQDGFIRFEPKQGTEMPLVIEPIKNGHYDSSTSGGVPPGEYRVVVRAFNPDDPTPTGPGAPPRQQLLPSKYNSQSTLELIIDPGEKKLVQDFTLAK